MRRSDSFVEISKAAEISLIAGARDSAPVRGLTHNFYRYPARFSPTFARAAIQAFTHPGDVVLDNHVGGGTSLVEALALGRHAIGIDISTLAEFVATVKTTVYSEGEIDQLSSWARGLPDVVNMGHFSVHFAEYDDAGYFKHLSHPARWRVRKAIEQTLSYAMRLGPDRLESFGRCVILRTAQWALDGRKKLPTISEFRMMLARTAEQMISAAREFSLAVSQHSTAPIACILNRSASGIESDKRFSLGSPRLVLTSPPYPGIHVLYHRWQVDGRKEAPLPFVIANKLDGAGSSYYTMGDRKRRELATYFASIKASMSSVAAVANEETIIVQMLAFSDATWQLERYLATMEEAGLQEAFLPALKSHQDGRLWRDVPNRRWYSDQRGETPGSREVVLIHRRRQSLARSTSNVH